MRQPHNNGPSRSGHADLTYRPANHYSQLDRSSQAGRSSVADRPPALKPAPWRLIIGICLAVALVIVGAAIAYPSQFKHQLELSIVRQPTPYTQLYFTSPSALSSKLRVDQKNNFEFTIENDEARTYQYTYTVTLADFRSHLVVTTASLTLGNGDRATQIATVTPKDRKSKYLITVALEGGNQSIHFYGETS